MIRHMKQTLILGISLSVTLLIAPAHADEAHWLDRFGLSLGGSYGWGTMENSGMGLPSRTMSIGSVEGLLSYSVADNWQVGIDVDYSILRQQTDLSGAGGTNLKGQAWIVGIGTRYFVTKQLAIQGSIGFFGQHNFDHPTSLGQSDHLSSPIALRLKPQWFAFSAIPNLSLDADLRYQRWSTFDVEGTDYDQTTTQFFGGFGLTYHFGKP